MKRSLILLAQLSLISGLLACSSSSDGPTNTEVGSGWGVNNDIQLGPDADGPSSGDGTDSDAGDGDSDAAGGSSTDATTLSDAGSDDAGPDVAGADGGSSGDDAGQEPEVANAQGPPCDGGVVCEADEVCSDEGLCVPEVCEPNPCVDIPLNGCDDAGQLLIYSAECTVGDDDAAVCTYEATPSACGVNQICLQGVCTVSCDDIDDCAANEVCVDGGCVAPPPECCDTIVCNPAFEECLSTDDGQDCYCDPIYELCLFMGDNCPVGYNQPEPYVCVDYGGQDGICRVACEGPPIGSPDTCDGAEWLCGALPGQSGTCLPADCSGYFDDDFGACGPDATCLPTLDESNVCVPDGPDDEGDTCGTHDECGHGLLCIDNFCAYGTCSADSNQVSCAPGINCIPWTVGVSDLSVGNCASDCLAFTDVGCEDHEWCFPLANTPDGLPVDGYCVASGGTAFEGMKCDLDPNACVDGTICVVSPENSEPTCEILCTPTAAAGEPGSCDPGRGCSPLFMVNEWGEVVEVMDYGSCIPACTPWVSHFESGCSSNNWCQPMLFNSHAGECKGFFGELNEGDDCTEVGAANSCSEGLFCLGFMTPLGMDGTCHRLCDVDGGPGDTCAESQFCEEIPFLGADDKQFKVSVGVCAPDPNWQEEGPVTYTTHAQPIYSDRCTGCHTGNGSGGHDIGSVFADASAPATSGACAGLTVAECTLIRIADGSMPLNAGCGGPVADDSPNAASCVTVTQYALLEEWIAGGMLE